MSDVEGYRAVYVKVTWESCHEILVPRNEPRLGEDEMDRLLDVGDQDVTPVLAEMTDWEIKDRKP